MKLRFRKTQQPPDPDCYIAKATPNITYEIDRYRYNNRSDEWVISIRRPVTSFLLEPQTWIEDMRFKCEYSTLREAKQACQEHFNHELKRGE